jgi:cytochrome c553
MMDAEQRSNAVSAGNRMMKFIETTTAVLAACFLVTSPILAQEPPNLKNCTWCHGTSAEGYSNAPRLAGQGELYLEDQLMNFARHIRDNPYAQDFMWHAVANLSPEEMRDLSAYLSTLPARPALDGNRDLVTEGQRIYQLGIPDSNVAACVVCHGPDAEGVRQIPRLGGLEFSYLKRRLEEWGEGYHAAAYPMPRVAKHLSPSEIDALASYLSDLE